MAVRRAGQARISVKSLPMIFQLKRMKCSAFAEAVPLTFFPPHFGILVVQKCHNVAYCFLYVSSGNV